MKTLNAITESIEKWKLIALNNGFKAIDTEKCPLCMVYSNNCYGCPIFIDTGEEDCEGTVFYFWRSSGDSPSLDFDRVSYALEMVSYLQRLKVKYINGDLDEQ